MPTNYTPIVVGAAADASVFNAPLDTLDIAITQEQTARSSAIAQEAQTRSAEDDLLQAAYEAADDALMVVDADLLAEIEAETDARMDALDAEANARTAAITAEAGTRAAGDAALAASISTLNAVASTSGGTASTTLTRQAGAAVISTIGGNGTLTTVITAAPHGYSAGDVVQVAGTANYNGTSGPLTIISTTSFSYPSGVSTVSESTGTVASKLLAVASSSSFVVSQRISVTNDQGQLHTTTVSAVATGTITMTAAVPTTWRGSAKASVGAWVSTTIEEVALSRTAIPYGNSYGMMGLPDTVQIANANLIHPRAYGAVPNNPAVDNTAALNAALATGGIVVIDANTTYTIAGTLNLQSGGRLCGMGKSSVIKIGATNVIAVLVNDKSDVEIANLMIDGTAVITGGGAEASHVGVMAQNSQRVYTRNVWAQHFTTGIFYRSDNLTTGYPLPANGWGVHYGEISGCCSCENKDFGIVVFRECSHIRVINNECQRNGSHGIVLDDGTVADEGRTSADHPTSFAQPPSYCTVSGNVCQNNTVTGIALSGTQHCTVSGNVCEYNGVYKDLVADPAGSLGYFGVIRQGFGIELMNVQNHVPARYTTVVGNVCSNNRRAGIVGLGAKYTTILGNVCTDNGNDWTSTPTAAGIWLIESSSYSLPGVTAGYQSTLTAPAAAGATVIQVASTATGAAPGQGLYLVLTDGSYHPTRIVTVDSATQLTVATAIPGGKSAPIGAVIGQPAIWGSSLTAGVVATNTSIPVTTSAGATVGMAIQLPLDNGTTHSTTISAIADATHVTLAAGIPASRSAVAGTHIGQVVFSFATDPTLVGVSGPVFAVGSRIGWEGIKDRPANPNENAVEYGTVSAVSSGSRTVTLAVPPLHAVPTGSPIWNPVGSSHNNVVANFCTRTQAGRQPSGVQIGDVISVGNAVRDNRFLDLTGNSDNNWMPIRDANTGAGPPTVTGQNVIDELPHKGVAILNGGSPPSVTVATDAVQVGSEIRPSRATAATVAANTGVPFVYSRTNAVYAVARGTLLDAAAIGGATTIVVLSAADVAAGRTIRITLDTGATHTTTIGGSYVSGPTVPLTVGLPSAASINNNVLITVPAIAGSFVIRSTVNGDDGQIQWSIGS